MGKRERERGKNVIDKLHFYHFANTFDFLWGVFLRKGVQGFLDVGEILEAMRVMMVRW